MPHSLRLALLPLLLALAVVLALGSHYEAGDDTALTWLFSGVTAAAPVAAVPLYFHGYGHLLAAAYAAAPAVPWFGLLLGALLLAATGLFFGVLATALRPHLRPGPLAAALAAFFMVGWLEHWLWFSYVRVGLLLAAAAVLWAAQRPGRPGPLLLGLAGLLAAWALRPGLAVLGFVAVLPAAVLLAGGLRRAAPLLLGGAVLLAGATACLSLVQPAAAARTRVLDSYLAAVLDYDQLTPTPRTPRDSLAVEATRLWLLGDSTLTNAALYRRAYRFAPADYFGRVLPARLGQRLGLLARDYFPLALALAATLLAAARLRGPTGRWFWLVQLAFAAGLLAFAGLLKLPPRAALPRLDCWLLTNVLFLLKARVETGQPGQPSGRAAPGLAAWLWPVRWQRRTLAAAAGLALGLYGAKTLHRRQVLQAEQARHEAVLAAVRKWPDGAVAVLGGANDLGKSLSPFRPADLGRRPVLQLTGWPSHDASQLALRQKLAGTADLATCLRRVAAHASANAPHDPPRPWLLTPEVAAWLVRYLAGTVAWQPVRRAAIQNSRPTPEPPATQLTYYDLLPRPLPPPRP